MKSYFNTDKIFLHNYFPSYLDIARELGKSARVCEIGVLDGESLRMWQALFPTGQITGVDINPRATFPPGVKKILSSQDNPALAELGYFDLIVEDASHTGKLSAKTFEIMWPQVAHGGFYVLEDWFVGLEKYIDGAYDPDMLETAQSFLRLLTKDSECESVLYRYGLAIMKKRGRVR